MVDVTFQHGSEKDIMNSIRNKLLVLPDDIFFYPGHGDPRYAHRWEKAVYVRYEYIYWSYCLKSLD